MNNNFEYIANLQYKIKYLTTQVEAFESGEKYVAMYSGFKKLLSQRDDDIIKLKHELADAHSEWLLHAKIGCRFWKIWKLSMKKN